jgi:phosphohistidine phosphatase
MLKLSRYSAIFKDYMKIIYHQAAAIPFRSINQQFEILLVTSRNNRQWTIPKGLIEPGVTAEQTAVQEAYEEAGISGMLYPDRMLEFSYRKWQGICQVKAYLFRVEQELENWPEKSIRQRRWVSFAEASKLIKFPKVGKFLRKISSPTLLTDPAISNQQNQ